MQGGTRVEQGQDLGALVRRMKDFYLYFKSNGKELTEDMMFLV